MDQRQAAVVSLLFLSATPFATAQSGAFEEVELPEGSMPLAIAATEDGTLWVTLNGAWALARFEPESGNLTSFPLPVGPTKAQEELFDVLVDTNGAVWTASNTHAFRLDPETGNFTSLPLPAETDLSGGITEVDGLGIVVALVTADKLAVFDLDGARPARTVEVDYLETPDGPLDLVEGPGGVVLGSMTYANAFFVYDDEEVEVRAQGRVEGPVGLSLRGDALWFGEMGASSVARSDLAGETVDRFPTTPSHYFQLSGPSGIVALDGGNVLFVEHFADRVALLDPEGGVLEEIQVPGAPGANVQFVALAEGRAWFPLLSRDKLVSMELREPREPAFTLDTDAVTVQPGGSFTLKIEFASDQPTGSFVAAPSYGAFDFEPSQDGALTVTVHDDAPPGTQRVLLSLDATSAALGRYVTVTIAEEASGSPASALPVLMAVLALVALAAARPRRR